MDPKARRFLWDTVISIVKEGRSVVLTSHRLVQGICLTGRRSVVVFPLVLVRASSLICRGVHFQNFGKMC